MLLALLPRSSTNPHWAFAVPFPAPAPAGGGDAVGEPKEPCTITSYAPASVCAFASVGGGVCARATPPAGEVNIPDACSMRVPLCLRASLLARAFGETNAYIYTLYIYPRYARSLARATTRTQSNDPKSASTLFGDCAQRYFSRAVLCAMMVYRAAFDGGRSVVYMYMHSTHALGGARTHARERRRSHSRANECRASARQRHFLIEIFLDSIVGDITPCGGFIGAYFRVCAGGAPQSLYKLEYIGFMMDVICAHHHRGGWVLVLFGRKSPHVVDDDVL